MNDTPQLDHLVVVAHTLEQGAAWCEATLGVPPGPGGKHPLMGTHNRLLLIAGPHFERAYLEIIAIDPQAQPPDHWSTFRLRRQEFALGTARRAHARWFGMDHAPLQQAVRREPRLVHWVAHVPDLAAACATWAALGLDPGVPVPVFRDTPQGRLEWQITVRDDGWPQWRGAVPTLIQWGRVHPTQSMGTSGVALQALTLGADRPQPLAHALAAIGLRGMAVQPGAPALRALLRGPRGDVILQGGFDA
jgi:hypothetical protein